MSYTMMKKDCEKCGSSKTTQIVNAGNQLRVGWYCLKCRHMTPATDKEKNVK